MRIFIKDLSEHIGEEISVNGWVDIRRDQGKLIFLDLRDTTGKVQAVALPGSGAIEMAGNIRPEWVISVKAKVNARPEKNVKTGVLNGGLELELLSIEVLNQAETPAFDISTSGLEVNEEVRMEKKYLDMRRDRLQHNLKMRHRVIKFIRDELDKQNFLEIETPLLTNPTPEGSRSYVVPSRLWKGSFYALPQSPQQYKQLLMSGGIDRYFQIAKCMRDEDGRGDRQPEFTQMDMEMSFVTAEEVRKVNEDLLVKIVTTLFPNKKIQTLPFPILTYKDAMEKYGSDKPDLREDKNDPDLLAFCWVTDFPMFEPTGADNVDDTGNWTFTHNPFSRPIDEHMEWLRNKTNIGEIITTQYDVALNGSEIGGGSIRNHIADDLRSTLEIMGYSEERIKQNFGHMLEAFRSGTPPHGGIAWGLDRLLMILLNEPNIREVMAFPKTGEGKDLLMQSPAATSEKHLKELGLQIKA